MTFCCDLSAKPCKISIGAKLKRQTKMDQDTKIEDGRAGAVKNLQAAYEALTHLGSLYAAALDCCINDDQKINWTLLANGVLKDLEATWSLWNRTYMSGFQSTVFSDDSLRQKTAKKQAG